jgi:hypothetical protein
MWGWRYKASLNCSRLKNEIFSDPFLRENKNGEKKTVAVNRLAQ